MPKELTRRDFIKTSAAVGAGSVLGGGLLPHIVSGEETVDIVVVKGEDYFESAVKAVELLGGMETFVPKHSKVAILANPQSGNPGTFTKPDVVRAAIRMCKAAGAKKVSCISWLPEEHWEKTGIKKVIDSEGVGLVVSDLKDESLFRPVPVPRGKALKEARVMKTLFDYDVLIDMPITKDHSGNKFTGTLKNLMGLNSPKSNRTFHREDWKTNPDSIRHMEQCIADLNTVIHPDLCVVDATEFIVTNGPFGPGKLHKPRKIVAGIDRVAIDSYCSTLWGLNPKDIIAIHEAHEHGIGEMNLKQVKIKETEV
jgi:uncharacterized protein (DUF362 family)